jgi:enoyl-CoA hydratase/carnithine racemase
MSEAEPRVILELGPITRITLNRAHQANALDWQMGVELQAAVARIQSSAEVRAVLVAGAGKHFCGGGDFSFIEENTRLPREQVEARMSAFYRMFLSLLELPVATCAVMRGSAIGAGLCLALACDLRLAAASARVGTNFIHIGLHPGMGATALLPHVAGPSVAAELLLTGAVLDAETACAAGILTRVAPDAELDAEADRVAESLARAAPIAARQTVETLRAPLRQRLDAQLAREAACQAIDFGTEDVRSAILAFQRRERPDFVGR